MFSRSILSAFALLSAISAATRASSSSSFTNSFVLLIAACVFSTTFSTPRATLPTAFAATYPASENSPLKTNWTALPRAGINSINPVILLTT